MNGDHLTLIDGTLLLHDADGTPHTSRISEVIADARELDWNGQSDLAMALLLAAGVWLDQLMARVEAAIDSVGGSGMHRIDN